MKQAHKYCAGIDNQTDTQTRSWGERSRWAAVKLQNVSHVTSGSVRPTPRSRKTRDGCFFILSLFKSNKSLATMMKQIFALLALFASASAFTPVSQTGMFIKIIFTLCHVQAFAGSSLLMHEFVLTAEGPRSGRTRATWLSNPAVENDIMFFGQSERRIRSFLLRNRILRLSITL